jgi:glycosyltransferase involved in cell wall biosynthesis
LANNQAKGTICFVSLEIYPTTAGGVGILLHHTISFLLDSGYDVILLLDIPAHEFERYRYADRMGLSNGGNLHVYSVEELCEGLIFPANAIPHSEMLRSARIAMATEKLCHRHPIELVEFYDYCGPAYYFLGNGLDNPPAVAVRLHNTIELIARKIRSEFAAERVVQFAAERLAMQGADMILSPGEKFWSREMLPLYPEVSRSLMHVSPPIHRPVGVVEYSAFSRNIAFYGRLSTFKGLDTFIKGALAALRDPDFAGWVGKFLIMGPEETVASAYSLDEMKAFIPAHLQDRFEFTGRVTHVDLMERLKSVAFACFANRMESFCYAAHELHTAGIPLILSETAAFEDHFAEGETALFFDTTAMGLGRRMVELAQSPDLRLRLSKVGQARGPAYLVDHYARHLDTVRRLPRAAGGKVEPRILILANGQGSELARTLQSLRHAAPYAYVLQLDEAGDFRFASLHWRLETADGTRLDPLVAMGSDALIMIRAGDQLDLGWLDQASRVMARRADAGSISGWIVDGNHLLMQETGLLPEAAGLREPGLRTLIRSNPQQLLQDALMMRPGISESALMLEQWAHGRLTLTLPRTACDVTDAIPLPTPQREIMIRHEFDRFNTDYMTRLILESGVIKAEDAQVDNAVLARTRHEKGFAHIRAVRRSELGGAGGSEILFLRVFPDPKKGAATWGCVRFDGDWMIRHDPNGPIAGAMRTDTGSAQAYMHPGAAIDVLKSPWSGGVEILYAGKSTVIDLYSTRTEAVRLVFGEDGVQVRNPLGQTHANENGSPALRRTQVPPRFLSHGACDTIFLTLDGDDFLAWPEPREIADRSVCFDAAILQSDGGEESALLQIMRRLGARRLILSSRLPCNRQLGQFLSTLPDSVEIGLALSGANPASQELSSPTAQIAAWYDLLTPWFSRLTVLGPTSGLLDTFALTGAKVVGVPMLQAPVFDSRSPGASAPVSIALIGGELWPDNLMHMLAAVLLAADAGLDITTVHLPERFRAEARIFDEFPMPVPVGFYRDVAGLAFVGGGSRRIAIGCYPQEQMPSDLRMAASLGWLPLAGAVCDLDGAPAAVVDALTEAFWENGALLADRLLRIAADHEGLLDQFGTFAASCQHAGVEAMRHFLAPEKTIAKDSAPKDKATAQKVVA